MCPNQQLSPFGSGEVNPEAQFWEYEEGLHELDQEEEYELDKSANGNVIDIENKINERLRIWGVTP